MTECNNQCSLHYNTIWKHAKNRFQFSFLSYLSFLCHERKKLLLNQKEFSSLAVSLRACYAQTESQSCQDKSDWPIYTEVKFNIYLFLITIINLSESRQNRSSENRDASKNRLFFPPLTIKVKWKQPNICSWIANQMLFLALGRLFT